VGIDRSLYILLVLQLSAGELNENISFVSNDEITSHTIYMQTLNGK